MPDRFDKFTEDARRVLTLAQEESQRYRHKYVGTEHLLLGLLRIDDGVAARALRNLGVSAEQVRASVEGMIGRGDRMVMGEVGLTPRAKKVIELAVDEARQFNHNYIGTEHLLLGLVREGEGIAAKALVAQGVALDKLREEILRLLPERVAAPAPSATPGRSEHDSTRKLDERARRVITYAREEAGRFNHNYIGTEHLLLGLLWDRDSIAGFALHNLGVQLDRARAAVEFIIGRGDRMVMGEINLTPRARKVIELATDEARRLEDDHVGTEHLLLGMVREGEGIAAGVLESLGVSLDRVRLEVTHIQWELSQWELSGESGGVSAGLPLGTLLRVVSLGQSRESHDWEVTLLSLEMYAGGLVVNGRLLRKGDVDLFAVPELIVEARDDREGTYRPEPIGSGVDSRSWRFAFESRRLMLPRVS